MKNTVEPDTNAGTIYGLSAIAQSALTATAVWIAAVALRRPATTGAKP
jgi:hypothetical protein